MCVALEAAGERCQSTCGHVGDRCWHHLTPEERVQVGYSPAQPKTGPRPVRHRAPTPVAVKAPDPDPEPPLRLLPRLPSDAELIERLRWWAEEFDELDGDRYTARDFLEWVRLEHLPRSRKIHRATDEGPPQYTVFGPARALLYG